MTFVWLKLYLTVDVLGFFFGVSGSTTSRNTRNVLSALHRLGYETLGWLEPPRSPQPQSSAKTKTILGRGKRSLTVASQGMGDWVTLLSMP